MAPNLIVRLPAGSERVVDADEEVFLLYSNLNANPVRQMEHGFRGLGHVDSHKDTLTIQLEYEAPKISKKIGRKSASSMTETTTVDIELFQDKTALRSRKGDTGSVLWKASIDFARLVLQQIHSGRDDQLFQRSSMNPLNVLELGAGVGFLAIALSPHVQTYTATDMSDLVPLIQKNTSLNFPDRVFPNSLGSNVDIQELDWFVLQSTPVSRRPLLCDFKPADLLLVVDCIFHPSLLPALVETITYLSIPNNTVVLIVVELRAEDVIREFLQLWLDKPGWEIWRVGGGLLESPYVMWLGWLRRDEQQTTS